LCSLEFLSHINTLVFQFESISFVIVWPTKVSTV
jgi:hypothetical protein